MTLKNLALGIGFLVGMAEARDWGFSKDTVYAWNQSAFEMRDGVPWPKFDSVYLENHGATVLKFDTATLQVIKPNINPDSGWCKAYAHLSLNLRKGLNGPKGEFEFHVPTLEYFPTGFETFSLQPGEKIVVGPAYLGDAVCSGDPKYNNDSISVRLVFTSGKVSDTLYVKDGAEPWVRFTSIQNSKMKSHNIITNRVKSWVRSFLNRDLKGRNPGQ